MNCPYCTLPEIKERKIVENELALAFPGNMPIVPGHVLIIPKRHVAKYEDLTNEEKIAVENLRIKIINALRKTFGAQGFNFAWNDEKLAGQSVPHFHLHVIPRKENDTGIYEYEPRKFLYRPGERETSPEKELLEVSKLISENIEIKKQTLKNNYAFIDGQNLYLAIQESRWKLDYKRFRTYLEEKYNVNKAFLFIGFVESNKKLYEFLSKNGYTCIFKPTLEYKDGTTKGNCDSELVLQTMLEFDNFDKAILVTGDGDFHCLAECLVEKSKLGAILIPNKFKFSALLKFIELRPFLRYMNDLEKKLRYKKEKAP